MHSYPPRPPPSLRSSSAAMRTPSAATPPSTTTINTINNLTTAKSRTTSNRPQSAVSNASRTSNQSSASVNSSVHSTPTMRPANASRPTSAIVRVPQTISSPNNATATVPFRPHQPAPSVPSTLTAFISPSPANHSQSFAGFTGPYTYLPSTIPSSSSTTTTTPLSNPAIAQQDWYRIETIKNDIRLMHSRMLEFIEQINPNSNHSNNQQLHLTEIPEQIEQKLWALANTQQQTSIVENNKHQQLLLKHDGLQVWEKLVSTALHRYGHSSDYIHTLTSTISLLEVWSIQLSRLFDIVSCVCEDTLKKCSNVPQFISDDWLEKGEQSSLLALLINEWKENGNGNGNSHANTVKQFLASNNIQHSSRTPVESSSTSTTTFYNCLPSLVSLLTRMDRLARVTLFYDGLIENHTATIERQKHEIREAWKQVASANKEKQHALQMMSQSRVAFSGRLAADAGFTPADAATVLSSNTSASSIPLSSIPSRPLSAHPSNLSSTSISRPPSAATTTTTTTTRPSSSLTNRPQSALSQRSQRARELQEKYLDLSLTRKGQKKPSTISSFYSSASFDTDSASDISSAMSAPPHNPNRPSSAHMLKHHSHLLHELEEKVNDSCIQIRDEDGDSNGNDEDDMLLLSRELYEEEEHTHNKKHITNHTTQTTLYDQEPTPHESKQHIAKLTHEIRILRASLQEARLQAAVKHKKTKQSHHALLANLRQDHARMLQQRTELESELNKLREQYQTAKRVWEKENERKWLEKLRLEQEKYKELEERVNKEHQSLETKLLTEKQKRDRQESDRWYAHQKQLEEQQHQNTLLQQQLDTTRTELSQLREIRTTEQQTTQELRQQLQHVQQQLEQQHKQQEELEDQQRYEKSQLSKQQQQEQLLQQQQKNMSDSKKQYEYDQLEQLHIKLTKELTIVKDSLQHSRDRESQRAKALELQQQQYEKLQQELQHTKQLLLTAEENVVNESNQRRTVTTELETLKQHTHTEHHNLRTTIHTLTQQLTDQQHQYEHVQQQHTALTQQHQELQHSYDQLHSTHENLIQESKLAKEALDSSYKQQQAMKQQYELQVLDLQKQLEQSSETIATLEHTISTLKQELLNRSSGSRPSSRPTTPIHTTPRPASALNRTNNNHDLQLLQARESALQQQQHQFDEQRTDFLMNQRILQSHREELEKEKLMLSQAASLLSDRLLVQLQMLYKLSMKDVEQLKQQAGDTSDAMLINTHSIQQLNHRLTQQYAVAQAMKRDVEQSRDVKQWRVREPSLQQRIDALKKECTIHERILQGIEGHST